MENQVLSIEQMKHLQELGLDTNKASMCWLKMGKNIILAAHDEYCYEWLFIEPIPTFTLQDILDLLPSTINNNDDKYWLEFGVCEPDKSDWYIQYESVKTISVFKYISSNTSIDAAYGMLCWCIENKYI